MAEADRDISVDVVVRRTIQFGLANYPELDRYHQWLRFKQHMDQKYSVDGYIKLWIPGSPNERNLNELRALIADTPRLRQTFEQFFEEEYNNQ